MANYHRDRSRHRVSSLDATDEEPAAPSPFAAAEDAQAVREAIARLSPERQHLILLKYVEGMTNAEIGRVLDRSEGAVKSLLRRTLAALKRDLSASHGAEA